MKKPGLIEQAFRAYDAAHAQDPRREMDGEREVPQELLYSRRMSARLEAFAPDAPETVKLAARCQHLCRWTRPRDQYPMTRAGYHAWREDLAAFHAEQAAAILQQVGYDPETISRVRSLVQKNNIKTDPEMQLLEDVICLVFLEHYFDDFAKKHDEEKLIQILHNTWLKMSDAGHAAALALPLSETTRDLVQRAIG